MIWHNYNNKAINFHCICVCMCVCGWRKKYKNLRVTYVACNSMYNTHMAIAVVVLVIG